MGNLAACKACFAREGRLSPELANALLPRRHLALAMLEHIAEKSADGQPAVQLFESLLRARPNDEALIDDVLDLAAKLSRPVHYDGWLNIILDQQRVSVPDLVRQRGAQVVLQLNGTKALERVVSWFVDRPRDEAWNDRAVVDFLRSFASNRSEPAKEGDQLQPLVDLASFQHDTILDPAILSNIDKQLDALIPPTRNDREPPVLAAVLEALTKLADVSGNLQSSVEAVLESFSRQGQRELLDVYSWLIQGLHATPPVWERANLLTALLAPALGQLQSPELERQYKAAGPESRQAMEKLGQGLLLQVTERSSPLILEKVRESAREWQGEPRERWLAVENDLRPSVTMKMFNSARKYFGRTKSESHRYVFLIPVKTRQAEDAPDSPNNDQPEPEPLPPAPAT